MGCFDAKCPFLTLSDSQFLEKIPIIGARMLKKAPIIGANLFETKNIHKSCTFVDTPQSMGVPSRPRLSGAPSHTSVSHSKWLLSPGYGYNGVEPLQYLSAVKFWMWATRLFQR